MADQIEINIYLNGEDSTKSGDSVVGSGGKIAGMSQAGDKKNENKAIIFNKTNLLNNYQNVIDNVTKANIDYIDSYFSLFSVLFGEGPFLLRINKYVKKYFANNNYDISNISSMTIKEFNWYLKKYRKTYKDPVKKMWLKSQKESMKKI